MEIINERLNYSIPSIQKIMEQAYKTKDFSRLIKITKKYPEYRTDLNIGTLSVDMMTDCVKAIQGKLCIDSDDINKLEAGLMVCEHKPILNSCTIQRLDVLDLRKKKPFKIILMAEEYDTMKELFNKAISKGFKPSDIYFDPSMYTIAADQEGKVNNSISLIKKLNENMGHLNTKTIVGISNIIYGMPPHSRLPIQNAFLTIAKPDAIIGNPKTKYKILSEDDLNVIKLREVLDSDNPLKTLVNNFIR